MDVSVESSVGDGCDGYKPNYVDARPIGKPFNRNRRIGIMISPTGQHPSSVDFHYRKVAIPAECNRIATADGCQVFLIASACKPTCCCKQPGSKPVKMLQPAIAQKISTIGQAYQSIAGTPFLQPGLLRCFPRILLVPIGYWEPSQ